ncbi:MAG: hypothetical protein ACI9UA_004268 [Pseudoalteromonas tetraodonis]|jgi:hypothetical protein
MGEFLLKMLGAPPTEGGTITGTSWSFQPIVPAGALIAMFVVLAILSYWLYSKTPRDISRGKRFVMATLRTILFALLLLLLLRPTLDLDVEKESRRTLVGLLDTSASFDIRDGGSDTASRLERATETLTKSQLLPKLEEQLDVNFYRFDRTLAELDLEEEITAEGPETALGNTLRQVLNRRRGEPLAGIFLTTDGVNTTGESPGEAAAALREAGVPLYIYGIGSTIIQDLAIESVDVASTTLIGDAVPATIRIRSRGMEGRVAKLKLALAGATATEKEFTIGPDGTAEIPLAFLPNVAGDFELTATVSSETEETLSQNNSWSRNLRVLDSRIRVLMVEQSSRWEFKYIQAMLLREQRVDLDCLVIEADPEVTRTPGSPYIETFPTRREDLYKYDLVMFGDIDPKNFSNTQLENLASFVSEAGGSLAVLSGKRFTPHAYRFSPLAALLPVEVAPANPAAATRPIKLTPTPAGLKSPTLQLEDTPERSKSRWAKLPPIYWTAAVNRAKPAAQVYLTDPQTKAPILAIQRYGAGEVLFLGTDNTWRWRKNIGDIYHSTFWGQLVQRLAGTRLLAGSRRSQLRTDQQSYAPSERVTVYAKLANTSWDPVRDEIVRATLTDAQGGTREVLLRAVPEEPGQFRAEFSAPEAGRYRLAIGSDPDSLIDLSVRTPDTELQNPTLDEALLQQLATTTGGQYFTTETIQSLPDAIQNKTVQQITKRKAEIWASPLFFLLIILVITTEWILRKFAELK